MSLNLHESKHGNVLVLVFTRFTRKLKLSLAKTEK